jgi:hypothetical protein
LKNTSFNIKTGVFCGTSAYNLLENKVVFWYHNNKKLQVKSVGEDVVCFKFYCRFRRKEMVEGVRKLFGSSLAAAGMALFVFSQALAADAPSSDKILQPQGLNYTGIYALRQIDPNLTGQGVKFAVVCRSITYIDGEPQNDYQPNISHKCFNAEQFNFYNQPDLPSGISPHSTAVCSILFGKDSDAFNLSLGQFNYEGVAPQAKADVYEFWHFLTSKVFSSQPVEADVLTADIGSQFEDWWTRGIEAMAEHQGLVVVAGIGNGSDAYDPPLYPAAGGNVIGVGVVDSVKTDNLSVALANFSLAHPEHSSIGPTSDKRCKPDIVAVGNCLVADANDPGRYEPAGNWSSFSTPLVAGTIGLLVQKAKEDPDLKAAVSPDGGNCVMKAILLNSASKLPFWHKGRLDKEDDHNVPLDYAQGAGLLNATEAYKQLMAAQHKPGNVPVAGWDGNLLKKGRNDENIYNFTIAQPAGKIISVTAAWNKHYDDVYPFEPIPAKDADLRLELWGINPADPNSSRLLDYSDSSTDNVEHIYYPADVNYTQYEIVISYSDSDNTADSETQRYGLAWNVISAAAKDSILWYDLNADGVVNEADTNILIYNSLTGAKSSQSYLVGDIDADGVISSNDVQKLTSNKDRQAGWHTN